MDIWMLTVIFFKTLRIYSKWNVGGKGREIGRMWGNPRQCSMAGTRGSLAKDEAEEAIRSMIEKELSCHAKEFVFYPVKQCCSIVFLFSLLVSLVMPSLTSIWAFARYLFNQIGLNWIRYTGCTSLSCDFT